VGEEIAAYAQNFLGTPYVYGGSSTSGFDCSGFTKYVYGQFGYTLNRTATDQLSNGVSVRKDELQPGDLVFFKYRTSKPVSHVGIYIGSGQFVHASTNSYPFDRRPVSGHYANVYVYGRRVV
jgi:cell wall-associated NlpC family hydrolase